MHHGPEFIVVLVVGITLAVGAAMRMFSTRTRFPYTIAMLLIGMGSAFLLQKLTHDDPAAGNGNGAEHSTEHGGEGEHGAEHSSEHGHEEASHGHEEVSHGLLEILADIGVTPDLIMFVFLPALIFESAYSLEVHAFLKNLGAIVLLAVPALLICTACTAALMMGITSTYAWGWSWTAALVFGALISATDPVAVVSLLREVGAPKRLAVLIEGESLLNDGTAIVIFSVLIGILGGTAEFDAGVTVVEFLKVVTGGIATGLILAMIVCKWLDFTFNDPLVEITLTIVLAYMCMVIGEGMFHVSGVMAIVVAGLYMNGPGKTRISPGVAHFLHQFWEMLAYIANTLIFFLVGIVIADQIKFTPDGHLDPAGLVDLQIVLIVFAGIVVIRFFVTFCFLPLMGKVSDPVSPASATVMAWGGLRGAVSLALALIVSQNENVPKDLRDQILVVTAGVVLLTIIVNGSTTGFLLNILGLTKAPLSDQRANLSVFGRVLKHARKKLEEISQSKDLRTVNWGAVRKDMGERIEKLESELAEVDEELAKTDQTTRVQGLWRQTLRIERQAFWSAFAEGTLGADATRILDNEIAQQLDRLKSGELTAPETRFPVLRGLSAMVDSIRSWWIAGFSFERLALRYDLSRGEVLGAQKVLHEIESWDAEPGVVEQIRDTYVGYLRAGKERLEDLRANLPEVAGAIETRLARQVELNVQRDEFEHLAHEGVLEEGAVRPALEAVERDMKRLRSAKRRVALPDISDLCRNAPLFSSLPDEAFDQLGKMITKEVLSPGDVLFSEGEKGDSMYVIGRGAMLVVRYIHAQEVVLDVLGGGDILGEMALLTGGPRVATVRASTTATVGKISRSSFNELMNTHPQIRDQIWDAFAKREMDNYLRERAEFVHLNRNDRAAWIDSGTRAELADGRTPSIEGVNFVFIATGSVNVGDRVFPAPALIEVQPSKLISARQASQVLLLPPTRS